MPATEGWSAPPSRAAWLAKKSTYRRLTGTPSDLRRQSDVAASAESHRPRVVILAAAKVGGILANASHPVDFLEDNLAIELAVFGAAVLYGVVTSPRKKWTPGYAVFASANCGVM